MYQGGWIPGQEAYAAYGMAPPITTDDLNDPVKCRANSVT